MITRKGRDTSEVLGANDVKYAAVCYLLELFKGGIIGNTAVLVTFYFRFKKDCALAFSYSLKVLTAIAFNPKNLAM